MPSTTPSARASNGTSGSGRTWRGARVFAGAAVTAAAAGLAWSVVVEPRMFRLQRIELALLPVGAWPMRVLHVSDLHMVPGQRRKAAWVSGLADLRPDLVINSGDTIAHRKAVPAALNALGELLDLPGAFVFGNNDFYAPRLKSPHRYFKRPEPVHRGKPLPWRDLRAALAERGWLDLTNGKATVTVRGQTLALAGVDDPHTRRDSYDKIAGPAETGALLRIGVAHSPEPRVLDRFAGDGYELLLAGHTHGGQVRIPGIGAIVTNCGVDRSRARGLSRWGARSWLNVSGGLGASPFMPFRLGCRPEATLITLRAWRESDPEDAPTSPAAAAHRHGDLAHSRT